MTILARTLLSVVLLALLSTSARAQLTYEQRENIVYAEVHGIGLVMDVFVPTGEKNGLGIVDVISGAWSSSRGKINDHKLCQTYTILCAKGYTVFAIRPGSLPKFSGTEMVDNLKTGIRWVKSHAAEYGIDPENMGMTGASAGGHLALLTALTSSDDTRVKCLGVFFPPTDLLNWKGKPIQEADDAARERIGKVLHALAVPVGTPEPDEEGFRELIAKICPARLVTPAAPPLLLFHGDADPLVPLQQSEILVDEYKKAGVPVTLHVKPGGGHPWLTIFQEVAVMADWFDEQLGVKNGRGPRAEG